MAFALKHDAIVSNLSKCRANDYFPSTSIQCQTIVFVMDYVGDHSMIDMSEKKNRNDRNRDLCWSGSLFWTVQN